MCDHTSINNHANLYYSTIEMLFEEIAFNKNRYTKMREYGINSKDGIRYKKVYERRKK